MDTFFCNTKAYNLRKLLGINHFLRKTFLERGVNCGYYDEDKYLNKEFNY